MVNGERIKQIRELLGWTQKELGERIGAEQPVVAMMEGGRRQPTPEMIAALVEQTKFPLSHFTQSDPCDFPLGSLLFRGPKTVTAKQQAIAHRFAQFTFDTIAPLRAKLTTIPLRIPRLESETPASAARLTRSFLGLSPDGPVDNLTSVLERSGVIVIAIPTEVEGRDAFSGWALDASVPVIALSAGRPTDRIRFSLAHELGHLVMHQSVRGHIAEVERAANEFAAEFLTPADAIRPQLDPPLTLTTLAQLKLRWKVAIQSLIRRAKELGTISQNQYEYLFKQISLRGWRTREPANLDPPPEVPRSLPEIIRAAHGAQANLETIAASGRVGVEFLRDVLEAHSAQSFLARGDAAGRKRRFAVVPGRKRADA